LSIVALVLAVLGVLAIRVVVEGRGALSAGDDHMARGNPAEAIAAFETSARWYLPLAPHVDDAYSRLRGLGGSEDPAVALAAWRGVRSAARATRTLWQPHGDHLAEADAAIARLSARTPGAAPIGAPGTPSSTAEREAWHQARLSRDGRAGLGGAVLAAFGIVLWLGGAGAMVSRGLDGGGKLIRKPALVAGAAIVVGLVCWFVGLYNA
jgi:hypothetical protein